VRFLPLFGISRGAESGLKQMQRRTAEATKGDESKPATYTNQILALGKKEDYCWGAK
jgi:hypothetical protein